jgi:hypothetical protein
MQFFMLIVGIGLCLVFVVVIVRLQIAGAASRRWPRVMGKVQKVVVETQSSNGPDMFSARVDYHFLFEGARYRGRRHLGRSSTNRDEVEDYARSYVAGQQVEVFVNDKNPRNSTLEPGFPYGSIIPLVFSTGMLVVFLRQLAKLLAG